MFRVKPLRSEQRRLALGSCVPDTRMPRHRLEKRAGDLRFLMTSSALVFVLGLCMVTPVLAQTPVGPEIEKTKNFTGGTPPENVTSGAIGTLCPPLVMSNPSP